MIQLSFSAYPSILPIVLLLLMLAVCNYYLVHDNNIYPNEISSQEMSP